MLMKETDLDSERFDGLSRALGSGATRRGALGVLAGFVGIGLSGVASGAKSKAKAEKVDVCHYNAKQDTWVKIRVSPRGWDHGHSKHEQDFHRGADEDDGCCNDSECTHHNTPDGCFFGVCNHTTGTGTCKQMFSGEGSGCLG
jgi:hypothetical protein